jgi:hypothetical protein
VSTVQSEVFLSLSKEEVIPPVNDEFFLYDIFVNARSWVCSCQFALKPQNSASNDRATL